MKFRVILFLFLGLILFVGCYDSELRDIFIYQITREQINIIKNTIISEGYIKGEREDFRFRGSFRTDYTKEINVGGVLYKINIHLSFRPTKTKADVYRNAGVYICDVNRRYNKGTNIPEIQVELNRMEDILYKKFSEFYGEEYVKKNREYKPTPKNFVLEPIDE